MFILLQLLSLLTFFICLSSADQFSPDANDFDAYGLKIAANTLMIVEARNDLSQFIIQFAPYTDDIIQSDAQSCWIDYDDSSSTDDDDYSSTDDDDYSSTGYDDSSWFVYTVVLGKKQSTPSIFFVGEMIGLEKDNSTDRTFVGSLTYTGNLLDIDCDNFNYTTTFVPYALPHQEHLEMVTDPLGLVAYGFSDLFTFSYTPSNNSLIVHLNNSLSPSKPFLPLAVDYDGRWGIIAGFLEYDQNSRIKYIPTIMLFSIDASTAIATPISSWSYPTNGTTWQAGQSNIGADQYNPKFDMYVSLQPNTTQALVGIQSLNTVFLFGYTTTNLTLVTSVDHGRGIGFGKGVIWLSDTLNSIAVLANVYSTNYVWSSSNIYIYNSPLTNNSIPVSIFPNIQQPLYSVMSSVFLNIITTSTDLVLQDNYGYLFVILAAASGNYSFTVGPSVEIVPAFSSSIPCIAGTYKNVTGIRPCFPCPTGTKNDATNRNITTCIDCATNTFCPLGSVSDSISNDLLSNITQVIAYPKSPDITGLDDILFFTLFSIGSSARCVVLSPIFWTLIVAAIVIIIVIVMVILKCRGKQPKKIEKILEKVFERTDLIREGEMWGGGLATFCVLVLIISCCVFSAKYYNSYPIETAGPSTYTCDTTILNAQFSTSLQPLSVPVSEGTQGMIDLLNDQEFNLNVAFLNTIYTCTSDTSDVITLNYQLGQKWLPISTIPCNSSNYILSLSALLPFRPITVQFTLPNISNIGGLSVGLSASGKVKSSIATLQDLGFSQLFSQNGLMLGQDARITLQLTKVINNTSPLITGADEVMSAIWTGSFALNYYESFITATDYLNTPPQTSNLTITISETPYFIYNEQSPIARLPEIIYHDFLFITMVIAMFALMFVIYELFMLPGIKYLFRKFCSKPDEKYRTDDSDRSGSVKDDLENSTASSNKQDRNESKQNKASPRQRQIFSSNQSDNHNDDNNQKLPETWNRQAYL